MTFIRTPYGLSNQHKFYGVDVVVYIEGGSESHSLGDVEAGMENDTSEDIFYWRTIFSTFASNKRVTFKPIGSKSTLEKIAKDISGGVVESVGGVKRVYVAMDQDFDRFKNKKIDAEGVFYTWGYSWENDIFAACSLVDSVLSICPVDRGRREQPAAENAARTISAFLQDIRWFVAADTLASMVGGGIFDRENWKKYVKLRNGHNSEPYFHPVDARTNLARRKQEKSEKVYRHQNESIVTRRDCFGHIIGNFTHKCFSWLTAENSGSLGMPRVSVIGLITSSFGSLLSEPEMVAVREHHEKQFGFINT